MSNTILGYAFDYIIDLSNVMSNTAKIILMVCYLASWVIMFYVRTVHETIIILHSSINYVRAKSLPHVTFVT